MTDFDVDLVYFWCNGNDPEFRNRKEKYSNKESSETISLASNDAGFVQSNELYYSVHSAKKHLPWIRKIFIVTDRQNPNIDGVEIVDHNEILEKSQIPCFNIYVLEANVTKIKGLSQHFILANDDTFVYRDLDRSFFFGINGIPRHRFMLKENDSGSIYQKTLDLTYDSFTNKFNVQYEHLRPHHNMDAYLKSTVEKCLSEFNVEYKAFQFDRFRTERCFHRTAWSLYDIAFNGAEMKIVNKNQHFIDSICFKNTDQNILEALKRQNPGLFCINDTRFSNNENRALTEKTLKRIYSSLR